MKIFFFIATFFYLLRIAQHIEHVAFFSDFSNHKHMVPVQNELPQKKALFKHARVSVKVGALMMTTTMMIDSKHFKMLRSTQLL